MEGRGREHIEVTDLLDEYEKEHEIESIEKEIREIDKELEKVKKSREIEDNNKK